MPALRSLGFVLVGFCAGALIFSWPFGLSENDVADRLVEYREKRGGSKVTAACHQRLKSPDYYCEVNEAIGLESPGHSEYIVRRRGDKLIFDRVPTV